LYPAAPYFEIHTQQEGDKLRLQLTGELDLVSVPVLESRLEQLRTKKQTVRLDLSRLEFMDSAGIHLLISAFKHAREDGWQFEVDPDLSPQVRHLFKLTDVERITGPRPERPLRVREKVSRSFPTCLYCEDRIGIHEPIIVVEHDRERETSLGREPELARRPRVLLVHSRCAPTDWNTRTGGVTAPP
jgi:anti-sigma B factor antagonist